MTVVTHIIDESYKLNVEGKEKKRIHKIWKTQWKHGFFKEEVCHKTEEKQENDKYKNQRNDYTGLRT